MQPHTVQFTESTNGVPVPPHCSPRCSDPTRHGTFPLCVLGSNLISRQSVTKRWQQPTTLNYAEINISLGAETAEGVQLLF